MFTLDSWSADDYDNLTEYLKSNADLKYRDFHSSLVPDTESNSIIGIRMPIMRKIAKEICALSLFILPNSDTLQTYINCFK